MTALPHPTDMTVTTDTKAVSVPLPSTSDWRLEPHVCLVCMGRIVSRLPKRERGSEERRVYRCTNCGATGRGQARTLCMCGTRYGGRDAGIRCTPNPSRSTECPSEITAKEVG